MADILVVDNNHCINDLLTDVLTGNGHRVATAQTGLEALHLIGQNSYQIAFIDLGLPDMDGVALIQQLKQNHRSTIPVVISGRSDFDSAIMSLKAGAFDYLLKPFDIDNIIRVAKEACLESRCRTIPGYADARGANNDAAIKINDLLTHLLNTAAVASVFFVSLIGVRAISGRLLGLTFEPIREMVFLAISLSFCWALATTSGFGSVMAINTKAGFKNDLANLGIAYVIFAAILFFVSPLANCGLAMIGGCIIGLAALSLNRRVIIPRLETMIKRGREGRKQIVIVGTGIEARQLATKLQQRFGRHNVESISSNDWMSEINIKHDANRLKTDTNTELYLERAALNRIDVNKIVNDFTGKRIVIDLTDSIEPEKDKPSITV